MGGAPIMALALVAMPIDKLPIEIIGRIIQGGESICAEAGIPIAGGHTIDSVEPIYGLVVMGLVHPDRLKKNSGAQAGDKLILGKPLGVGVLSAAVKKDKLDEAGYRELIANTTKLNKPGQVLSELAYVHALTDVTGFGLLGHTLELCRGAGLSAKLTMRNIPLLPNVEQMAAEGMVTGASGRNWAGYGHEVDLAATITAAQKALLTDPQTSGGLLVSCTADRVDAVLGIFKDAGFAHAAAIGEMQQSGNCRVAVD
jgi:selenide, water dikinase